MASPLVIGIGLHYYAIVGDYRGGDFSAPAVADAIKMMVESGLLEPAEPGADAKYRASDGLFLWAKALLDVPWPVKKWTLEPPTSNAKEPA